MAIESLELEGIRAAISRIEGIALRTPLIKLAIPNKSIWLKLENLQPIGSFKIRGAANAMGLLDPAILEGGVWTASAGNMAQGVGWVARELGIPFRVVVPDHAPRTKLDAIERLGGTVTSIPFDRWWEVLQTHRFDEAQGHFIHPVSDKAVIEGHGTIGMEILEDLPDVDDIIVPYGGGGLSTGIATGVKAIKPDVRIHGCEVDTAAPLAKSLSEGRPCSVDYIPSFVDGMGGKTLLDEMWPFVSRLIDDSWVVSLREVADSIRLLAERHRVIAEGAGAAPLAAALKYAEHGRRVACVISGGNIDSAKLSKILEGELP